MKTKIMLEIFIVLVTLVFSPVATTLEWFDASDSAALCNDFTRAGYFLRRVNTSDKWIIHLESGGVCYSNETCNRRFFVPEVSSTFNTPFSRQEQPELFEIYYGNFDPAEAWRETVQSGKEAAVDVVSPLMTSMRCFENKTEYFPRGLSVNGTDILDRDCEVNPLFCDYNHVVVPYCSSDIWLGTEIDGVRNNTAASRECTQCFDYNEENGCFRYNPQSESIQFTFRGRTIFMSVIRDLLAMGMDGAAEVVLTGSSAGGLGALNNAKWLQSELQSVGSAELIVILDSAWFINFQGNIYREFDGTVNRAESEAQRQNVLTLLSILGGDEACSDVRLGYPCCFSPHCLLTQRNAAGERYYPEVSTFAILSLYDVYLLAPSLAGLETFQNQEEISIGYGIDFLLTVGEYGGQMNTTVMSTGIQRRFFSYYATQCFQHVYLATSTLWGEPGSSVFGTSSVELQRDLASFSFSLESDLWSLQLAGPSIQEALTRWYYNRTETVFFRDNCGGPHCNMECPERFMLAELNSNNWPFQAKYFIVTLVVFISALCIVLKVTFRNWLRDKEKKPYDDSETDEPHEELKYLTAFEGKGAVLSCKKLSYTVEASYYSTSKAKAKEKDDSVPYFILNKVIPQLTRDVTFTVDNICRQIGEVDCMKQNGLGYHLRVPRQVLSQIVEKYPSPHDQTRATIEYWHSTKYKPSWRWLMLALEESNEQKAVANIKKYVEPLTDDSLTVKNVSSALEKLKDWTSLCAVLSVPISMQRRVQNDEDLSETEKREAVVKWWLRYSPNASWTMLAGRLHFFEERQPLEAVLQYYERETPDSSLNPTNLWQTLQGVTEWWGRDGLCHYLDIPNPVEQGVRKQIADATQQKEALLHRWLRDHPAPSWEIVADAVYMIGERHVLERVKRYITGRSLNVDDISKQLKGVNCMKKKGLAYQLRVPHHVCSEIEKQHSTKSAQTKATVEYWLSVDPKPSWRRLMMALENINEHEAMNNVKPNIEAPTDPRLTASNVSHALKSLTDLETVCDVLCVPLHRQNLIKIEHSTDSRRRQAMVEWWLQYSPNASWKWLAGQLYYYQESKALKAVSQFVVKEFADSTGPAIKALYTLTDVQDWSSAGLRLHLQVPDYVEQEIRQQTSDATQQKKALLKRWLKEHPAPSWAVVTEALYQMEEHDVLNRVKMFIAGRSLNIENISKQLKGVNCMKKEGLGHQLRVPSHVLSEIEKQHSTQADQTTATVQYWLSVDPKPSWRRLMMALQRSDEPKVVNNVTPYIEPLSDPSLTASNICTALKSLRDLDKVCKVPSHRQKQIKIEHSTEAKRRQAMVEWWLQHSPHASWKWMAGQLYYFQELTALEAVLQYTLKAADSTLPSTEALHTLIDVKNWWSLELRQHLQVPYCVVQEIHQQTSDATEQKEILLKRWLSEHPAPSMAVVTEALYQMEEHEILKRMKKFIHDSSLTVSNISRHLEEVDCIKEMGLGHYLNVPDSVLREIEEQHSSKADQMTATIEYWLSVDPTPSWRRVLMALEKSNELEAAQYVRPYVEKLTDSTLTADSVFRVVEAVSSEEDKVFDVLDVPLRRQNEIWQDNSCDAERRMAVVEWWLSFSPSASWTWLAGQLYYREEKKALEIISEFIPREEADSTLTPANLWHALGDVTEWWNVGSGGLHMQLGIPFSVKGEIYRQTPSETERKTILLSRWLKEHPAPSWAVVKEALYQMKEHSILKEVKTFIAGEKLQQIKGKTLKQKEILVDISTTFKPNELTAVMGPSGCGKTTFLDVLTGRRERQYSPSSGIFIDDQHIDEKSDVRESYIEHTGYVLQLATPYYEELTVLENLRFSAVIKVAARRNRLELLDYIDDIMKLTGLHKLATTQVGGATGQGLSGGQKRRLLLALQLLTQPKFIILDEPLSGLDSGSAYELLVSLQKLARSGRTVILTIHRPGPDLFNLFDNVLLLYKGKIAYEGKSKSMCKEFMEIVRKRFKVDESKLKELGTDYEVIEDILNHDWMLGSITEGHQQRKEEDENPCEDQKLRESDKRPTPFKPSTGKFWRGQFWRLAALEARASKRETGVWQLYFPVVFFLYGFLLGTVYLQQTNPLLIVSGFAAYSFASSLVMFPMLNRYYLKALDIYQYERWDALAWSHDIVVQGFCRAISLAALPVVICAGILYLLLVNAESYNVYVFLQLLVVNLALNQTWTALTIALTCAFTEQAVHISTVIVSVAGFTAGFFIPIEQIPWWYRWISYINPNYYGFSASAFLLLNDFKTDCTGTPFECYTSSGEYVLGQFSFEKINPYVNISILLVFTLVGLLLAWFSMWWNYNITYKWKENFKKALKSRKQNFQEAVAAKMLKVKRAVLLKLSCFPRCCSHLLFCGRERSRGRNQGDQIP